MAPRKQPIRLQDSALNVLTKYCADTVLYHLANCSAAEVDSCIIILKDKVCADIPGTLFNDFAVMFLQRISEVSGDSIEDRLKKYGPAVVDVIADDRLTKVEPYPRVADQLLHLLYCSLDRLRNLRHLHLRYDTREYPKHLSILKNCNLENLTIFECRHTCTNEVLHLIPERCPNLTTLDIRHSEKVTSAGLDVLKQCSKLRMVKLFGCREQPNDLIIHWLSNDEIKNITCSIEGSQHLMSFGAGVYPKLKSLHISNMIITNAVLEVIVRSFPSLETLDIDASVAMGDFHSLRSLLHLTLLSIWFSPHVASQRSLSNRLYKMEQVESLFTEVGNNLTSFSISVHISQLQQVVDFVYETCKNIKYFKVGSCTRDRSHTITIPPFENLESLSVEGGHMYHNSIHLQFTRLSALKKLVLYGSTADLRSILLDHDNFPRIAEIDQSKFSSEELEMIRETLYKKTTWTFITTGIQKNSVGIRVIL